MRPARPLVLVLFLALAALLPQQALAGPHHSTHRTHKAVVVLDPGHGGWETGAADASGTLVEKNLNLAVAKLARSDLQKAGYTVYLTRTTDSQVNVPPRDVNGDGKIDHTDDLVARSVFANRHHADVFVSIHFDGSTDPTMHGTHGYYCPARPFWRKSKLLAGLITAALSRSFTQAGYPSPNDGIETDVADVVPQARADYPWFLVLGPSVKHYTIGTNMPGALIETLYLSSPRDDAALRRSAALAAAGRGYAQGIEAYLKAEGR